jgi:hypothetical protein
MYKSFMKIARRKPKNNFHEFELGMGCRKVFCRKTLPLQKIAIV